jgi:hypothetical protein
MSVTIAEALNTEPFDLCQTQKSEFLSEKLSDLTRFHYDHCNEYKKILNGLNFDPSTLCDYRNIPFIPVKLFKERELLSIPREQVFKLITSSGTSGAVSKIFLDKETASNQQKVLVKIVSSFTGGNRLPMIILDSPSVIKDRKMFSARGAGILGFSIFGSERIYAFNDDMSINTAAIESFLEKHQHQNILLFGFTFIIWQHFYRELKKQNYRLDLSRGILIHGGGWKKFLDQAVSKNDFKESLYDVCLIRKVYDYYGMIEQTGTIYMQCDYGHLHASKFSDVIIRNPKNFNECNVNEKGLIQVVSILPKSYPGHSILTEDEGVLLGIDDCSCGRKGKYFEVLGRIKNVEIRGCSDTYE